MTTLTPQQIAAAGLPGWTQLAQAIHTRIATPDFATALALVDRIGAAAEARGHHPDLRLGWGRIDVSLVSHDAGGITERDLELARTISGLAAEAGYATTIDGVRGLEISLDTPDLERVAPFWRDVFGLDPSRPDTLESLRDPHGLLPELWFQESGDEVGRQRWHFDLWVDPSRARAHIDAALAAGGTLVSDDEAPSFWVLADPEGNRMCICTVQDRGRGEGD